MPSLWKSSGLKRSMLILLEALEPSKDMDAALEGGVVLDRSPGVWPPSRSLLVLSMLVSDPSDIEPSSELERTIMGAARSYLTRFPGGCGRLKPSILVMSCVFSCIS